MWKLNHKYICMKTYIVLPIKIDFKKSFKMLNPYQISLYKGHYNKI